MRKLKIIIGLFVLLFVNSSLAASVTLAWDASPDSSVTGYKVYWGISSGTYTNSVAVGNVLTARVTNLNNNITYYFAATAHDSAGIESEFSNEVAHSIPLGITNNSPTISFIPNQTINRNYTSARIPFVIYDSDSPLTNLTLTYSYSNPLLFNSNSFLFTGTGTNRNLYLTPLINQVGTSTITLKITDDFTNQTTSTFTANVIVPQNLVYVVSRLEYGTNLTNIQRTNVLLKIFTNPPPGQFYRQYLVITNNF